MAYSAAAKELLPTQLCRVLAGFLVVLGSPVFSEAQQVASAAAPVPGIVSNFVLLPAQSQTVPDGSSNITGVVVDPSGAAIPRASIRLLDQSGRIIREVSTGSDGTFRLEKLTAGTFQVTVKAPGFATFTSTPIVLVAGQSFALPQQTVTIASANAQVQVNATDSQVAESQIRAAEKQRVLGFYPEFLTSYQYDAVPLKAKQKYSLALRDTLDPAVFLATGFGAGIEQAENSFKGYGQGAAGYGKRYAALYGDGLFGDLFAHAVYSSLFHQDPRYFYQGTGTVKSRFVHAVSFSVAIRGDNGKTVPNYSYILGDLSSGALSNAYYPHADRGVGLVFSNAAIGIAGRAASSLLSEFVLPRFTTHKAGVGKP